MQKCCDLNLIHCTAPKTPKIDTDEFDGKIQQLITMGISEVRLNLVDNETLDHISSSCIVLMVHNIMVKYIVCRKVDCYWGCNK